MAKEDLIPFTARSKEEVKELNRKGGIRSGQVRREKATLKSLLPMMMSLEVKNEKDKDTLKALGISDDDMCNGALVSMALLQKAMRGNVQAIRLLAELNGENDVQGVTKIGASGKLVFDFGGNEAETKD